MEYGFNPKAGEVEQWTYWSTNRAKLMSSKFSEGLCFRQ